MFDAELKRDKELKWLNKKIKRLIRWKNLDRKKIYIFGVSIRTRKIIQILRKYGLEPENILDNDEMRQNSYCARVKVIAVDRVENFDDGKNAYIVSSAYWREMIAQLESRRVKKKNICLLYQKKKPLVNRLLEVERGKYIYDKLIKKYGNVPVFLCPYTGTGDIYLIGTFWTQYTKRNGIDDYVFVVVNGACKKVAMLFGIKNIEVLKKKSYSSHLLNYYLLYPNKVNLTTLNDSWPHIHTNPLEWFRGYKGLDFTEMFRRFVFNLPDDVKPEPPELVDADDELFGLFEKYQLKVGRTVILSPYSNTLADLADEFWEKLAEKLKEKGYTVCTNSSGNSEPAVAGTKPVFFPLNIAPQFVEKAGYFIGIRSGFCDVISAANAGKIILYDAEDHFYNNSAFEYFSLKQMGLSDDAVEIQFKRDVPELLEKVLKQFK